MILVSFLSLSLSLNLVNDEDLQLVVRYLMKRDLRRQNLSAYLMTGRKLRLLMKRSPEPLNQFELNFSCSLI